MPASRRFYAGLVRRQICSVSSRADLIRSAGLDPADHISYDLPVTSKEAKSNELQWKEVQDRRKKLKDDEEARKKESTKDKAARMARRSHSSAVNTLEQALQNASHDFDSPDSPPSGDIPPEKPKVELPKAKQRGGRLFQSPCRRLHGYDSITTSPSLLIHINSNTTGLETSDRLATCLLV